MRNMGKPKMHRVGDLQLQILRILWQRGEGTVADVLEDLSGADLAYTTIATMLRKMEVRGLVTHRNEGRSFVYRPKVKPEDISHRMSNHLVDRLFEGSLLDAVKHLLTTREVSREELAKIEQLIAEKKRSK